MGKRPDLDAMSIDEMWQLHEEISQVLSDRLTLEKRELEKRLAQLMRDKEIQSSAYLAAPRERRKYPRVFPKYQNPDEPSETWSGRGKQPRWLKAALNSGHTIEEFVIKSADPNKAYRRQGT